VTTPRPESTSSARKLTKKLTELLDEIGDVATSMSALLAVFAILLYAVLQVAYSIFYEPFGLRPDDLGFDYLDLLARSALGIVLLLVLLIAPFGLLLTVVGLFTPGWLQRELPGNRPSAGPCIGVLVVVLGLVLILSEFGVLPSVARTVATFLVLVLAFYPGFLVVRDGLRSPHKDRWRGVLVAAGSVVLIAGTAFVMLRAATDRAKVLHGHPAEFTFLGFPITGWRAEDATITWTNANVGTDLASLANRCLLYFGQSNGTAYFYRSENRQVLRISTQAVAIHTGKGVCTRKP
jgi:hypothetical protein